uniref:Ig-like domain-containing protein n=1 Tax=Anas zonorhyncha TaxID=75864 RepID=A0A8B9UHV9_9AVES
MGLPWGCSHPSLTSHARGLLTSLVTLLLLQLGSAQLRVVGPGHPVTATVGQDVVLPCHLSPQRDARSLDVRWIRDDLSETVHHYRNGEDLYREQMRAYAGRTELARDGLSAGILDLRITGLRPSDDGQYVCTVKNADAYDEATVELVLSGLWLGHGWAGLSLAWEQMRSLPSNESLPKSSPSHTLFPQPQALTPTSPWGATTPEVSGCCVDRPAGTHCRSCCGGMLAGSTCPRSPRHIPRTRRGSLKSKAPSS